MKFARLPLGGSSSPSETCKFEISFSPVENLSFLHICPPLLLPHKIRELKTKISIGAIVCVCVLKKRQRGESWQLGEKTKQNIIGKNNNTFRSPAPHQPNSQPKNKQNSLRTKYLCIHAHTHAHNNILMLYFYGTFGLKIFGCFRMSRLNWHEGGADAWSYLFRY